MVVQAQALDSACLAMLAEVMGRTGQLDTMEYLMAGMWILLRTPANRALLSTAFDPKKVAGTRYGIAHAMIFVAKIMSRTRWKLLRDWKET